MGGCCLFMPCLAIPPRLSCSILDPAVDMSGKPFVRPRGRREAVAPEEIQPEEPEVTQPEAEEGPETPERASEDPPEPARRRQRSGGRKKKAKRTIQASEGDQNDDLGSQISISPSETTSGSLLESHETSEAPDERIRGLVQGLISEQIAVQLGDMKEIASIFRELKSVVPGLSAAMGRGVSTERPQGRPEGPGITFTAAAGAPGDEPSGSESGDSGGPERPPLEPINRAVGRRDSIENLADAISAGSELSKFWGSEGLAPKGRLVTNQPWPERVGALVLDLPSDGSQLTPRHFLNFLKAHLVRSSQSAYPLLSYIEQPMRECWVLQDI